MPATSTTPQIGFRHHAAAAAIAARLLRHHLELAREAAVSAAPPFWMSEGSWDAAALATVNALSDVDAAVTDAVAEAQRALNGLADAAREPAWSGAGPQLDRAVELRQLADLLRGWAGRTDCSLNEALGRRHPLNDRLWERVAPLEGRVARTADDIAARLERLHNAATAEAGAA